MSNWEIVVILVNEVEGLDRSSLVSSGLGGDHESNKSYARSMASDLRRDGSISVWSRDYSTSYLIPERNVAAFQIRPASKEDA